MLLFMVEDFAKLLDKMFLEFPFPQWPLYLFDQLRTVNLALSAFGVLPYFHDKTALGRKYPATIYETSYNSKDSSLYRYPLIFSLKKTSEL